MNCDWNALGCSGYATYRVMSAKDKAHGAVRATFSGPFCVCNECKHGVELWLSEVVLEPLHSPKNPTSSVMRST